MTNDKTLLNTYEQAALINAVNDFSTELEKYRIGIFRDGPNKKISTAEQWNKNIHYKFEVQFKGAASTIEENDKELNKVTKVVDFLNSFGFTDDMKPVGDKGIAKKERIKLENAFEKAIQKRNAEAILKVLGTVKDE